MLKDFYKSFLESASCLEGFKPGTKNEINDIQHIALEYCKAEILHDQEKMTQCISAVMIRYWYMIPYLYDKCKSLKVEYDDCVIFLYEAVIKTFKYKGFLDDNQKVSKDANGFEKCLNRCIDSVRQGYFQQSNTDSRKINYMTYSIDESVSRFGDSAEELYVEDDHSYDDVDSLVREKIIHKDILSALVIDSICYNDCFNKNTFSKTKLVSGLKKEYILSFINRYKLDAQQIKDLNSIVGLKRAKLNKRVEQALLSLKGDEGVLSLYDF